MNRDRERGAGYAKALLWLAVLAIVVYLGFKIIPHFLNNVELQDFMITESRFATYQRKSDEQIRETIFKKASDLDIDWIKREDIKVETAQGRVKISIDYTVPVELPGYTLNLNFKPVADNRQP